MFKIWIRTLTRYKLYTLINIAGLSLGICAVVAIFLFVVDELSYDQFQANRDRLFRVNVTNHFGNNETRWPTTPATLGEAIRNDIPDAEEVGRIFTRQASVEVINGNLANTKFREANSWFADPRIFEMFTFNIIAGDKINPLADPNKIVIARSAAERFFGSVDNAIGGDIMFEGHVPMVVSAVYEDLPSQSYFEATLIAHFENYYALEDEGIQHYLREDWIYNPIQTFVLLKPGVDVVDFEAQLETLKNKYGDERVRNASTFVLQPFTDIYLYSDFFDGTPHIQNVYILASIGFIILITACINFINLANVHSLKRAREIGIRKVLGAHKKALIRQFLIESSALVLIAFCVGVAALYLMLPLINSLSGKHFSLSDLLAWKIILGIAALFLVTSFLSGTYPAFFITRFNPTIVLKGINGNPTNEGYLLRKILMTTQFTIAIVLVVLSIVFWQQMNFIHNKPLGFETNNIITIPLFSDNPNAIFGAGVDGPMRARMNAFENELTKNAGIRGVTVSAMPPGTGYSTNALVSTDNIKENDNVLLPTLSVDYDFIPTFSMDVIAGRGFSKEAGTDHLQAFVINERAVKSLGWKDASNAIGQNLSCLGKQGVVIGVVKDFHFQGLQAELQPLVMEVAAGKFSVFSVHFAAGSNLNSMMDLVKTEWSKAFPEKVFEFHFLDDQLGSNYHRESQMVSMMQSFSVLAIVIAALGLFGLAAYVNHQRSKEISIRKILGASVSQVFYVLSKEFLKMSMIAFVIAVPLAYFFADKWLDTFAYKVTLGASAFAVGGVIAVLTVLITISYETIKSAKMNPAEEVKS